MLGASGFCLGLFASTRPANLHPWRVDPLVDGFLTNCCGPWTGVRLTPIKDGCCP